MKSADIAQKKLSRRSLMTGGAVAAAALPALSACSGADEKILLRDRSAQGNRITRLLSAEIHSFDPHIISDVASASVADDQFAGLTCFNGEGKLMPCLAEKWDTSADGLTWRFHLYPNIRFSDKVPITPDTFVRTYKRLADPATGSPYIAFTSIIENIRAQGSAVIIKLKQPYPELPAMLAHASYAAIPHHKIDALGEDWTNERPIVASGPYRATLWKLNDHIEMERNPEWHLSPAAIAHVTWRPVDNAQTAMRNFLAGQSDATDDYPPIRRQWLLTNLKENAEEIVKLEPYLGNYYYVFNTRKPPFNDARVREALCMSVEREWLVDKVLQSHTPAAYGFVPPALTTEDRWQPQWRNWPRKKRMKAAAQLLALAGYGPDNPLRFEMRFNSSPDHRRVCAASSAMWAPLGVEVQLVNSEAAIHFDTLQRADFTMARSGWIADLPAPENFLENFLREAGPRNYSGYNNAEFEVAFANALAQTDVAERRKKMAQAEAIFLQDWPIMPIYYYVNRNLVSPRVLGWKGNPMGKHPNYFLALAGHEKTVKI